MRSWLESALQELTVATDEPWDERRARFVDRLGSATADQEPLAELLRSLDEMPEEDRNELLSSPDRLDSLVTELGGAAPSDGPFDESAWQTFLMANGRAWDGTEESWQAFRTWIEYYAGEQGLAEPTTALLDAMATRPVADRVATFASYGVTITTVDTSGFGWVTEDQAGRLTGMLGSGWQDVLAKELPKRWGADWQSYPATHRTAWLTTLIETGDLVEVLDNVKQEVLQLINTIPDADSMSDEDLAKAIRNLVTGQG